MKMIKHLLDRQSLSSPLLSFAQSLIWPSHFVSEHSVRMLSFPSLFMSGLLSSQLTWAAPLSPSTLETVVARQEGSCNTASNRACWTAGFDIYTDYEIKTPLTGVVRDYTLTLTESDDWTGPDGVIKKKVMLVNGTCSAASQLPSIKTNQEFTIGNIIGEFLARPQLSGHGLTGVVGPTIYAHWGDTISIKVINNLKTNGMSPLAFP